MARDRGLTYEAFWELPHTVKVDLVAEWEADWRIAALQQWEAKEQARLEAQRNARKK